MVRFPGRRGLIPPRFVANGRFLKNFYSNGLPLLTTNMLPRFIEFQRKKTQEYIERRASGGQ